jgi:hypothetical protein
MIDTSPMPGECEAISVVPLWLRPLVRPRTPATKPRRFGARRMMNPAALPWRTAHLAVTSY